MHASTFLLAAGLAAAKTITVKLNDNSFSPNDIKASKGDVLEFQFGPSNHSVVMGAFNSVNGACTPANKGGFWSGYVAVSSGLADKAFKVTLNDTEPVVFYSSKDKQCPSGMVGVVNANGNSTRAAYVAEAAKLSAGVSPRGSPYGGVFVNRDSSSDSSSSTGTSTASGSSASSTGDSKSSAGAKPQVVVGGMGLMLGSVLALAL
ncbi:hypothetical protein TD95_003390 [Thielaviopsis punctulata]|uniref:Phytocyanin domain-containing protein n=1 Tax=Thielaviopsis punctulata TaxID=72032 RepID=A0A0F4ZJD1_9PEZI|nr:hypothetical protein TD95_003390 [Thielaviopsis punctulata]